MDMWNKSNWFVNISYGKSLWYIIILNIKSIQKVRTYSQFNHILAAASFYFMEKSYAHGF